MKQKHRTRKERRILQLIEMYRSEADKPLITPTIEQLHIERLKMNYEKEMAQRLQHAFALLTGQQAGIVGDNLDALSALLSRTDVNTQHGISATHVADIQEVE